MASERGISASIVGQTKSGIGAFDGAMDGTITFLYTDGLLDGLLDDLPDGATEGILDGTGDKVGLRLGLEVMYRTQAVSLASTHVGVNELNCSVVSNTEASSATICRASVHSSCIHRKRQKD